MRHPSTRSLVLILAFCLALSACQGGSSASQTPEPTPGPTATATPEPRLLTICLGQEPSSLYMYGSSSRSMWSVLEALYDGPIDYRNFSAQPVILTSIPSLENGGAVLQPVAVESGQIVANINGDPVALAEGVTVFPSGCTDQSCAVTWDGVTPLTMDQMVATYTLLPGVTWSDGTPLTAADSVYSFQVSSDPETPVTKTAIQRTATYTAVDDLTVQWTGLPGYLTTSLGDYYWVPLPQHQLGTLTAADLLTSELTNQTPLGWGPYVIDEWTPGDHIRMVKNPAYFRSSEGLPYFDTLVFRFLGDQSDTNLAALLAGECDIVDQYSYLEDQPSSVRELELNGDILVYRGLGPGWETLDFGIVPASYDDGLNPFGVDRPNIFGDVRTRQAFTSCLDRANMVTWLYNNLTEVANSYLPPSHPLYMSDLETWPYDPEAGSTLLEQIGWRDFDNDPATPRVAAGISGVPDGTLLSVTLTTSSAELRQTSANLIRDSLAQCGIEVTINIVDSNDLYAAGPDGVLFGRQFDLAEYGWSIGRIPPCYLYSSSEIPSAANGWAGTRFGGTNITGYSNPEYDALCQTALQSGLNTTTAAQAQQEAMRILAQDLPSIPLFYHVRVAASRPDLCGMSVDISARSEFGDLENLNYGAACGQ